MGYREDVRESLTQAARRDAQQWGSEARPPTLRICPSEGRKDAPLAGTGVRSPRSRAPTTVVWG